MNGDDQGGELLEVGERIKIGVKISEAAYLRLAEARTALRRMAGQDAMPSMGETVEWLLLSCPLDDLVTHVMAEKAKRG